MIHGIRVLCMSEVVSEIVDVLVHVAVSDVVAKPGAIDMFPPSVQPRGPSSSSFWC